MHVYFKTPECGKLAICHWSAKPFHENPIVQYSMIFPTTNTTNTVHIPRNERACTGNKSIEEYHVGHCIYYTHLRQ